MTFTDELWQEIQPIYQAIIEHPFNRELASGELARERFLFYLQQDALYLVDFGRALAVVGSRSPTPETVQAFLGLATGALADERAMHEEYFSLFEVTSPTETQSPSCSAYTNFLLATAVHRSYEEGVAALLPCFWIYGAVGTHIYQTASAGNPYQGWIDTYAGDEFASIVDRAIEITEATADAASETARGLMRAAFVTSSRLEWMFWDSAYRLEAWQP